MTYAGGSHPAAIQQSLVLIPSRTSREQLQPGLRILWCGAGLGAADLPLIALVLGYAREVAMVLSAIFFLPFFGLGTVMYFLPSIIALARSKRDLLAIFLLNLFLGWSVIGWIVALVWAAKNDVPVVVR